ncbi:unnamed protein product [Cunninghamella blakesleeana]
MEKPKTTTPPPKVTISMDLDSLLAQEIEELNQDTPENKNIKEAVIIDRPNPNGFDDDSYSSSEDEGRGGKRFNFLRFGRSSSPHRHYRPYYRSYAPGSDDYEDDLSIRDPQLFEITERNRVIDIQDSGTNTTVTTTTLDDDDNDNQTASSTKSKKKRPVELVFSDVPKTTTHPDRIMVEFDYGLNAKVTTKKPRKYLIACDFGEESLYAMEWAMGTLLRNGDTIHIVSVIGLDEGLNDMDQDEKYRLWQELDRNSKTLISKVKSVLGQQLLYNIKIHVYSIAGSARESIMGIIQSVPLTMVVCGSSGKRGSLRGILIGGVSTYLVQKSPVPVSVVRPQKKKKVNKKKLTAAQKLSESVKEGQLKVDEVEETRIHSINGHGGY